MTTQAEKTSTLNYSPQTPGKWRKFMVRRLIVSGVLLLLAMTGYLYRSDLALRGARIYLGWKCARHVIPAGTVLVETDPAKVNDLLAHNPDYVADGTQWRRLGGPLVNKSLFSSRLQAAYWPQDFRRYYLMALPLAAQPLFGQSAIAFMGERRSANGTRRLVVIPFATINAFSAEAELRFSLVMPLPGLFGGLAPLNSSAKAYNYSGAYIPMRLHPGVADRSDPSHIALEYDAEANGRTQHGFMDVYLRDDDSLSANFRDPSAKQSIRGW